MDDTNYITILTNTVVKNCQRTVSRAVLSICVIRSSQ